MRIIDISTNDDTAAIAKKCNINFKQLAFDASQGTKSQSQLDQASVSAALSAVNNRVDALTNTRIPQEVKAQVEAALPAMVKAEVAKQSVPPMGSYLIMDESPEQLYPSTLWAQVGSVSLSDELSVPVWKRVESKEPDPEGGQDGQEEG